MSEDSSPCPGQTRAEPLEREESLRESQARFRQLVETIPGVVVELFTDEDSNTRTTFVSSDSAALLGLEPDELRENPEMFLGLVHCDDRADVERLWRRPVGVEPVEQDFRYRGNSGVQTLRLRAAPARRVDGGLAIQLQIVDVSRERQIADELFKRERQENLGVIAAGVAHNFNNMLSVIIPALDVALDKAQPNVRGPLEDAIAASDQAAGLVRRLMRLAQRAPAGEYQTVDLVEMVDDVVNLCRNSIGRDARIEVVPEVDQLVVRTRDSELRQVLFNLLFNAEHATQSCEEPLINVVVSVDASLARIEVVDNGEGFSSEVSQRLAEPFFTTKPSGEGTGLGLASALAIVGELGGSLSWSSEPGRGARFVIDLPLG